MLGCGRSASEPTISTAQRDPQLRSTLQEDLASVKEASKASVRNFSKRMKWFRKNRSYLPSKDLTHLICFQSKESELLFKSELYKQTAVPKSQTIRARVLPGAAPPQ
jgi:hypothetical protein